jgi:DNA ligase-1
MLACKDWTIKDVVFPCMGQPKFDGVRALVEDGKVYSRSGKLIRNERVQKKFGHLHGADGELMKKGFAKDPNCCRFTTSIVNADASDENADEEIEFVIYDCWNMPGKSFRERLKYVTDNFSGQPDVLDAGTVMVSDPDHFEEIRTLHLENGYEGTIFRSASADYKNGRSTKKDGRLLASKPFEDAEAEIIGYNELLSNQNEATENAFGRTKRSSHKENMIPADTLGSLIVRGKMWEETFEIGTGFSAELRKKLWDERDDLKGMIVRFKYFKNGSKDRPRFPVFITFRSKDDM